MNAVVNATVLQDVDCQGDTVHGGSVGNWMGVIYDHIRFYVLISDLGGVKQYELAYNITHYLGRGDATSSSSNMNDTYLITVPEEVLITYLNSVLESDHSNFTITLGISIFCEDNSDTYDLDTWSMIRIKSFNLTFSYQKRINCNTYMAWNQIGNQLPKINETNEILQVHAAQLYFKYKIDQNWTQDSPNSEIQILIRELLQSVRPLHCVRDVSHEHYVLDLPGNLDPESLLKYSDVKLCIVKDF